MTRCVLCFEIILDETITVLLERQENGVYHLIFYSFKHGSENLKWNI